MATRNLIIHELLIILKTHITIPKYTAIKQGIFNDFANQWTDWLFSHVRVDPDH